ncbi:uncharacterized protein TNCV_5027041 [Trichonephila clavipes]|nr:uncharacterized protein TNCV_5027041 [Trichonephila clavipes]
MHITKTEQRYHSEIYLVDNMLYKDQTIKIPALCDVWMMKKSVASAAVIVGYNPCKPPRPRIKEALDVSLGYSSPCGVHILPKLIWTSVAMHNATVQQRLTVVSPNSNPTIVILQAELILVSKHNVALFRCPCPPFIATLVEQTPVVSGQG